MLLSTVIQHLFPFDDYIKVHNQVQILYLRRDESSS